MSAPTEADFAAWMRQWRRDTLFVSSITTIEEHPSHAAFLGAGKTALPYLVAELDREPTWLCLMALQDITGERPWTEADRGHFYRLVAAWRRWAKANGHREKPEDTLDAPTPPGVA